MNSRLQIDNATARRSWLNVNGLDASVRPSVAPLTSAANTVQSLGMVQLDPIRTVARAHDHILWTRDRRSRPRVFERLIETRQVFEHFSHDAVILPMEYWPVWARQLPRRASRLANAVWGQAMPPINERRAILARVANEGPLSSRDFEGCTDRARQAWRKPRHKLVLDWLWLAGDLAVHGRRGFLKRYDLTERIVPMSLHRTRLHDDERLERLHRDALDRLGLANPGELRRFWDACQVSETRAWLERNASDLIDVDVEGHDGRCTRAIALRDVQARLDALPAKSARLRIMNPFDPLVRDRRRLSRLFGFDYTVEMYVPQSKRRYGYYVYPLLEGDRFVGRADIRTDRDRDVLILVALWPEPGIRFGSGRRARLSSELARLARLAGVARSELHC